jgi:hypothetical protein
MTTSPLTRARMPRIPSLGGVLAPRSARPRAHSGEEVAIK